MPYFSRTTSELTMSVSFYFLCTSLQNHPSNFHHYILHFVIVTVIVFFVINDRQFNRWTITTANFIYWFYNWKFQWWEISISIQFLKNGIIFFGFSSPGSLLWHTLPSGVSAAPPGLHPHLLFSLLQ